MKSLSLCLCFYLGFSIMTSFSAQNCNTTTSPPSQNTMNVCCSAFLEPVCVGRSGPFESEEGTCFPVNI